ncbi:MAG: membrane protein insertase YidC [bacterium]
MDKNSILAIVLILIIFILWPVFMKKIGYNTQKTPDHSEQTSTEQNVEQKPADKTRTSENEPFSYTAESDDNLKQGNNQISPPKSSVADADSVIIENSLFRGVLSTRGGGTIISWKLKDYYYGDKKDSVLVEMIPSNAEDNLVVVPQNRGYDLINKKYSVIYDTTEAVKRYRFICSLDKNQKFEKEFIVNPNSFQVGLKLHFYTMSFEDIGRDYSIQFNSGLRPTEELKKDERYYQAYALQGDELLKTKLDDTDYKEGQTKWMAIRSKYFLMALIPQDEPAAGARLKGEEIKQYYYRGEYQKWKTFSTALYIPYKGLEQETEQFTLFIGPMEYNVLKDLDCEIEELMNFGWPIIRPISIAFYHILEFLNDKVVHNYGWAIIVLAILIKIVLYPLTRKSYKSMRAMQSLQPKITALKEKYKDDPQKLNQETMKLYKKEGVNPMGGCLPLLLQMPVLFALFNLFRTTIMLRQASFLGGLISDLSAPDGILGGFNLLPILMGATMIIQQRLSNQDPKQKAMAYFMPIFLVFIFFNLSSGLNLYYLMFNLFTIAQELLIKKEKTSDTAVTGPDMRKG